VKIPINRRRFPRYTMIPAYTPVRVRTLDRVGPELCGHVYDVSEGGARFEVDEAIEPGSRVAMQITLPACGAPDSDASRDIFVMGTVVRLEDEDEPGPVRTAVIFTHFARSGDRERLLGQFATGRYRLAA